jgi:hypothetical protein
MAKGVEWDKVGALMADKEARAEWVAMVRRLHEAASSGGPLEGWIFHGTAADRASLIAAVGVDTTYAVAGGDDAAEWDETEGSHWGTAPVAAFYAEDLIESTEDDRLRLAIVAVRIADLETDGPFVVDGQTLDCPLDTRLERDSDAIDADWRKSSQGWRDCLDIFGTLLVLGPVPQGQVHVLKTLQDVEALVAEAAPTPTP